METGVWKIQNFSIKGITIWWIHKTYI